MQPSRYDLQLYKGDTATWRVLVFDDDGQTVPTSLTGVTAVAQTSNGTATSPLTCTVVQPNEVDVAVTKAMWASSPPLQGKWDLQLTFPDNTVITVLAGSVSITQDVSP